MKPLKARKISKAPPQIANFFAKPLSPNNEMLPVSPNDRKRKLSEQEASSQNENLTSYAKSLEQDAARISKVQKTKKVGTLVSTFFQRNNNDDLSDFESPRKKIQFKTPPVIPKKKVTRKRKLTTAQSKKKNDAIETEMFEKVLQHHSSADGMSSDDLQMALALSRSLTDTNGSNSGESFNISSTIRNADPSHKGDIVRQTLEKFGFKRRDNSDYDYRDFFANLGSKRKWSLKFTPLTRRNEHIQKLKVNNKVKNILRITEAFETGVSETLIEYSITSSYLQQFFIPNSPSYNITAVTDTKVEEFYVNNLVPISRLRCGSLLKNWADIPGRDLSPQRKMSGSCNVDDIVIVPESPVTVVKQHDENEDLYNFDVENIEDPNSCKEVKDPRDILEYSSSVDQHREINRSLDSDIVTNVDLTNERLSSPDMFADYESSANNSLNDDVSENHDADVGCNTSKGSPCGTSDNYIDCERASVIFQSNENSENCGSQKSPNVIPDDLQEKDAIVLSSDDSNQGCMKIAEPLSVTSQPQVATVTPTIRKQLSFTDRLQLYNLDPALGTMDDDYISSLIDQSSQDSIVISDDEINYSININHHKGDKEDSSVVTMFSQESIIVSDSEDEQNGMVIRPLDDEVEERQSFSSIELENENDPENENGIASNADDEIFNPNQSLNGEDIINLSVRELCQKEIVFRSVNSSKAASIPTVGMASQESIVLSDSYDLNKSASQYDDIDERQSFASIDLHNEKDSESENARDINIDDEIYNSNQSLNDEDLVNLSVRDMCQKEFVSGSAKSSSAKSFSRTTSDLTFERKVWKPPKTPINLQNFSDDEFDEFDKLVRGNRRSRSPFPNVNSIEISDDELEKSLNTLQGSVHRGDTNVLDLPISPMECNEFIVQSMDQIYQVRTGKLVSPKPNYENMDSPTRLEHLKKYGLKTLSKRKAVICLEHIYNRLHPFIELGERDDLDNILSQNERPAIDSGEKRDDDVASSSFTTTKPLTETQFDMLQENEDVFYLPSAPRAKKPWCLQPLHIAWHNLIKSNSTLYDNILQYKPVDIMDIRSLFKSIDLRYETNDIISFLDRKCITFKTDNKRNVAATKS